MAFVRDRWTRPNPDKTSKKKRIRNDRWGKGKRWQVNWTEGGRRATRAFDTRDAAELFASKVDVAQDAGTWITKDKQDITLADVWSIWLPTKQGAVSSSTLQGYMSSWRRIEGAFGHRRCGDIQRAELVAWVHAQTTTRYGDEQPLSGAMKRKIGLTLKALFDTAVEQGFIPKSPLRSGGKDIPPQGKTERRYLRIHEIDALIDAAPTPEAALLLRVLLWTGIRPGEAKGLKVRDLDAVRGRLMIRRDVDIYGTPDETKNRNHRDVPVGGELLWDLEDAAESRQPEDWLLPDEHGNVWTDARWRRVWGQMCAQVNIHDVTTYALRHTAASMAIAAGANVKTIQRMLGHSSAALTLDVYGHLWDEELNTIPIALDAHMTAERERFKARRTRRGSGSSSRSVG